MKKALRWIVAVIAVVIVICVAAVLFKNPLLRKFTEYRVERETGLEATIGSFKLDLGSASVRISDFKLHDAPEFGGGVMLHMPELYLRLDREAADAIRFHEARVAISELNVVKNAEGKTNIFSLHKKVSRKPRSRDKDGREFGGIGELHVTVGTARYRDMQNPANNQEFEVGINDEIVTTIENEKDFETWATAFLLRIAIQQALIKARTEPRLRDLLRRPAGTNSLRFP